jgi:hypothetical protein
MVPSMKKWTLKECLDILQTVSLILGIFFIGYQIKSQSESLQLQNKSLQDNQKVNSASFVLKISDSLDKKYSKIMSAIDDHENNYKLLHKRFSKKQLEDYISSFETLGNLVKEEVITKEMAYNELGYDLEKAWCNKDVRKYINDSREDDKNISGPNAFFIGFEEMAKYSLSRDKKTCSDMDKE